MMQILAVMLCIVVQCHEEMNEGRKCNSERVR